MGVTWEGELVEEHQSCLQKLCSRQFGVCRRLEHPYDKIHIHQSKTARNQAQEAFLLRMSAIYILLAI